ncbi:hypothetical protein HDV00_004135 [Rhizophlyctis rosea]|nr:hypothetical protein HDV00_004135 [Rhizophlyctis rosea]
MTTPLIAILYHSYKKKGHRAAVATSLNGSEVHEELKSSTRDLNMLICLPSMQSDDFPENIVNSALDTGVNLIVLPLSPHDESSTESSNTHPDDQRTRLIENVIAQAPCTIAVFIDRGFGVSSNQEDEINLGTVPGKNQSIFVPFFGGGDDREALKVVGYLAAHAGLAVKVLHMQSTLARNSSVAVDLLPNNQSVEDVDASAGELVKHHHQSPSSAAIDADYTNPDADSEALNALLLAHPHVEIEKIVTDEPVGTVSKRFGEAFGRKDLVVVGRERYLREGGVDEKRTLRGWVDGECGASVVIVRKHGAVNL